MTLDLVLKAFNADVFHSAGLLTSITDRQTTAFDVAWGALAFANVFSERKSVKEFWNTALHLLAAASLMVLLSAPGAVTRLAANVSNAVPSQLPGLSLASVGSEMKRYNMETCTFTSTRLGRELTTPEKTECIALNKAQGLDTKWATNCGCIQ